jgi:hypothetical protein
VSACALALSAALDANAALEPASGLRGTGQIAASIRAAWDPIRSSVPPSPCGKQTEWSYGVPDGITASGVSTYIYVPPVDIAICVTPTPDAPSRGNAIPNTYVPSDGEISMARTVLDRNGETLDEATWYPRHVTGRHTLGAIPSTDDLIEFYSKKWGIPEDWLRAQYSLESGWQQSAYGDLTNESPAKSAWYHAWNAGYCPTSATCYESVGIAQVKSHPPGSTCVSGCGAEPLRRLSTAWNIDYAASRVRFQFDNPKGKRSRWGDPSYVPQDRWGAVCAWFSPYPFNNLDAAAYCQEVKARLAARTWETYD